MELRWAPGLAAVVGDCDRALRLGAASDGAVLLLQSAAGGRRCGRGGDHGRSAPPAGRGAAPWLAAAVAAAAEGATGAATAGAWAADAAASPRASPMVPAAAALGSVTDRGGGGRRRR